MVKFFRKNILPFLVAAVTLSRAAGAGVYSPQQLLPAGHWIYDALYMLAAQSGTVLQADSAPLSVAEIRFYFDAIPYEGLSDAGKRLYAQVQDFFSEEPFALRTGGAFAGFNLIVSPELLYKSNDEIPWTFADDYTGGSGYGAESGYLASGLTAPFVTLPVYLGFSDFILIETDPMFAKSFWGMTEDWNFTNIPYDFNDFEFLWPRTAYGSVGRAFNGWGVNFHVGKEGLQIGRTQTGSVFYNSTFRTDAYAQLTLYAPHLKYSMDAVQVDSDKFLYLHSVEATPFRWIKAGFVEGTLINAPFELRFLNPLMIMHSFGSWREYATEDEEKYYGEAHVCAYMGVHIDVVPCRYLRVYALYAQNEIQSPIELESKSGRSFPDSFGAQLGAELTIPDDRHDGWWIATLEGIYTTPFCYLKQGADWSLYRARSDMQDNGSVPICSWIGTPFGPDCIGFQARVGYTQMRRWSAEIDYLFVAHGKNSFGLFNNYVEIDGTKYWSYYPSVLYHILDEGKGDSLSAEDAAKAEDAEKIARRHSLTGVVQYTNQITLKGSWHAGRHVTLDAQATYSFIFNHNNEQGSFQHGVELAASFTYSIF